MTKSSIDSPSRSRITHAVAPALSDIPNGTYHAHQVGHEVSLKVRNLNLTLFAEREITGSMECLIEVKDGAVTVRRYQDSDFKEGSV